MSLKEQFIEIVEPYFEANEDEIPQSVLEYFEDFKKAAEPPKKAKFTEGGLKVIGLFQQNPKAEIKAKEMGEVFEVSSRVTSGWCRKLENDGYLVKIAEHPAVYTISETGMKVNVVEELEKLEEE